MARKFFVGGNFKMNGTLESTKAIISGLNKATLNKDVEVVISPPAVYLSLAVNENKQSNVEIAAQNVYLKDNGAYTGEISASMLKDVGAKWVILGHSERRHILGESSEFIAEKTKFAIQQGLSVILCIGETKEEREANKTLQVCKDQLAPAVKVLTEKDWEKVVIAYEPVWAIGTGLTATPEDAENVHAAVREYLASDISKSVADTTRILYGGSVNGKTAPDLSKKENIDGFLVGGASLKPEFIDIINV